MPLLPAAAVSVVRFGFFGGFFLFGVFVIHPNMYGIQFTNATHPSMCTDMNQNPKQSTRQPIFIVSVVFFFPSLFVRLAYSLTHCVWESGHETPRDMYTNTAVERHIGTTAAQRQRHKTKMMNVNECARALPLIRSRNVARTCGCVYTLSLIITWFRVLLQSLSIFVRNKYYVCSKLRRTKRGEQKVRATQRERGMEMRWETKRT